MNYADWKKVYIDKNLTLERWTKTRGNSKINLTIAGVAGAGASNLRSSIIPVKSRLFIEFQNHWAECYNVKVSDELADLNFLAVKEAAAGIELMLKKFPMAVQELTEFRVGGRCNMMGTSYQGQIFFSPNYFDSYISFKNHTQKLEKAGFYPKNTGIKEYGMHEVVHILEIVMIKKHGGGQEQWKSHIQASQIVIPAYDKLKAKGNNDIFKLRSAISSHAARYGTEECLADAVVDYIVNVENAAELSKEIWELFKEELR